MVPRSQTRTLGLPSGGVMEGGKHLCNRGGVAGAQVQRAMEHGKSELPITAPFPRTESHAPQQNPSSHPPACLHFSVELRMTEAAQNCPFLIWMTLPVLAAAISRSVCRHKKAGIYAGAGRVRGVSVCVMNEDIDERGSAMNFSRQRINRE